jgi:CubicO group peptidase (beta-lactamase class C family)
MTRPVLLAALALLTLLGSPLRAQPRPVLSATTPPASRAELVTRLDSLARAFLADGPSVGAQVAVVHGGDTLLLRGYGLADREARRATTIDHQFRIGSLTKQFTAAAIMRLAERGKLSLDDELSRWVPEFPLQGHRVTLRQLLNHTSGIRNYLENPAWRARWADDLTPLQVADLVARDTFDFAPGTRWSYSNTGYTLLGLVVERASGQPYAEFVRRELLAPLGLRHTSYCPNRPQGAEWASGYDVRDDSVVPAEYLSMAHPYAAGALCSTVGDFVAWQRALAAGHVVTPASYARMTTPDTLANGERLFYGYGLGVVRYLGHRMVMHEGGINGFNTSALHFPDDSLDVVVFSNSERSGAGRLAQNLARAVLGLPILPHHPPPPAAEAVEPALRDAVVGVYELARPDGGALVFHLMADGEGLAAQAEGRRRFRLVPLGDGAFRAGYDPSLRVTFDRAPDGRVTGVTVQQGGTTYKGPRRP